MTTLPNIPLFRSALLGVLATIQNGPTFANQDIMSFAGMCSTDELADHVLASFGRLGAAEKVFALEALQARVAPAPAYMVPQPCQQQQAQAYDPLCPVMDAAYFARLAPKLADPAWPNIEPILAEAEAEIRASVARRAPDLLAAAAGLGIEGPLALTGRYSAAPIPAPATALDRAYADINALGGYVDRKEPEAVARDELLGAVLTILERHGARDLPAALLQAAA